MASEAVAQDDRSLPGLAAAEGLQPVVQALERGELGDLGLAAEQNFRWAPRRTAFSMAAVASVRPRFNP
jgi:hypothetical protein